jgi:hypothetical protein
MEDIDFWKRLGIRVLRLFGVACTFVGYFILVELFFFRFSDSKITQLGLGLIVLGIPHILAANQLQKQIHFAEEMEPRFGRLLATSLILPVTVLFLILAFHGHGPNPSPPLRLQMATMAVYSFGALLIFLRRGSELTPWDRTFIRWGWPVLMAIGLPIAMWMTR